MFFNFDPKAKITRIMEWNVYIYLPEKKEKGGTVRHTSDVISRGSGCPSVPARQL